MTVVVSYTGTGGTVYPASQLAPTNAGTYAVTASISDASYSGTATETFTISKATATVTLGSLSQTYDGTSKSVTSTTSPTGLTVVVSYTGTGSTVYPASQTAPTNAGTYAVAASISDANYTGTATGTFTISKATASITLDSLTQAYDGTTRPVTSTTSPTGLTVVVTYTGTGSTVYPASQLAPTNAGTYAVAASISDASYSGTATGTLTISKATATVTLTSLPNSSTYTQTVTITAAVTSTIGTPSGAVTFYDDGAILGSAQTITNGIATLTTATLAVGTHPITATYNGTNYTASKSNTLSQTVGTASTTMSLTSTPSPSAYDATVTLAAAISPTVATGTVTFYDNGVILGSAQTITNGIATLSINKLDAGSHPFTATYSGDTYYNASTATTLSQVVNCASDITVTNNADTGAGSLRQAIANVCVSGVIRFDATYFSAARTITLDSELSIAKNLTIDGADVASPIISGNNTVRVFNITSSNVTLNNLSISNGSSATDGGGIYNDGSTLTITNSTLSGNSAIRDGGGIANGGVLTVTNSTLSGNSASRNGGGIANGGTLTVTNSTLSGNSASPSNGGIYGNTGSTTMLKNTIVANSSLANNCAVASGSTISDGGNNLDSGTSCGFGSSSLSNTNPLLGALGNYGGKIRTIPLLPGSPAIDGSSSNCLASDQRGIARGATCDTGAFESQGFTLSISDGDGQSALVSTTFTKDLSVAVTANTALEPVTGGQLTFTPPANGASATINTNPASIGANGKISVTASANGITGDYIITTSATGANSLSFNLTNINTASETTSAATNITSTGATLNGIVNANLGSSVVNFEYGLTITSYDNSVTAEQSPVSGATDTLVSKDITGLTPNTTYVFRVKSINDGETSTASALRFTTLDDKINLTLHNSNHDNILSAALGESVHASATVTNMVPGGSVSFTSWQNTSCTGEGTNAGTISLDSAGVADASFGVDMTNDGISFQGHFNDNDTDVDDSPCIAISTSPNLDALVFSATTNPTDHDVLDVVTTRLTVQFNMDVLHNGPTSNHSVENPANFMLVLPGQDGVFQTSSCGPLGTGGLKPDDLQIPIESITYDPLTYLATLNINYLQALLEGEYRLFICGTTSITDPTETIFLNNHAADSIIDFQVEDVGVGVGSPNTSTRKELPDSGFAPDIQTILPVQPDRLAYADSDMWLEIPRLGVREQVLGVPESLGWDISWLGDAIGYLEGTAFPTWNGNSVLTGHVTTSSGRPGPFAELDSLKWGDQVIIHAWGQQYIYEIRSIDLWVRPDATGILSKHEERSWLTLITCHSYDPKTGTYRWRTIARATLVCVK